MSTSHSGFSLLLLVAFLIGMGWSERLPDLVTDLYRRATSRPDTVLT